jgi:apolipoprotein N-acyltransferase
VPATETLTFAAAAAAGGLALALAYPNFEFTALAWTGLAPVIVIALWQRPAAAFGWGWLAGLLFFFTLLSWLNFTFSVYSTIPGPLIYVPTIALASYCALYVALFAAALAWVAGRGTMAWALLCAPFFWVAAEWVRGHLMGGFPWGLLGYSQYRELRVIQIAELGGVYAVSFVVVAANSALAGLFVLRWRPALIGLVSGSMLVLATLGFGAMRLAQWGAARGEVHIGIMQPAIEQPLKFDPNHAAQTLGIYLELTRRAARDRPQLLVWPETAMPTALRRDTMLQRLLTDTVGALDMPLLVGSIDVTEGRPVRYQNTAFLITRDGIAQRYDKIQLVPFGEYVPFSALLGFVRGWAEFVADLEPGLRPVVFSGPPSPFGVVICYEGIFPELVREFVKDGARFMVNMTNDAWFGRTSGPAQHLAMYPLRAVEHRLAVVRAANTGISAFIAPTGRIVRRLPLFERSVMTDTVPLREGRTLYTRFGDWLAWLSLGVTGVALAVAWRRSPTGERA